MNELAMKLVELRQSLLVMAGLTETMVANSIASLVRRDESIARSVIEIDEERVNRLEIEIENTAITLMALYQPEASDLRMVAMIIKINSDLERLGDHAVNIAEAAQFLIARPQVKPLLDLPRMADLAVAMLRDSLNAFMRNDPNLALQVCARDTDVDNLKDQVIRELVTYMASDADTVDRGFQLMMIALNLERIADHATNIAEDVIYIARGDVIKHGLGRSLTAVR